MTPTRFLIATVAKAFGFHRRNLRMADAASEMHLLREAEAHLGMLVWENCENIDEISVEYWNLRKLVKERGQIQKRIDERQAKLDQAHLERSEMISAMTDLPQEALDERLETLKEMEDLARERDEIILQARLIRRSYDGLKMKLEVLTGEKSETEPEKAQAEANVVRQRLATLRTDFQNLKTKRQEIAQRIEEGDRKVDAIEASHNDHRKVRRTEAAQAFQLIGDANKELSTLRAEAGVLDTQIRHLQSEIGRHVSRNTDGATPCRDAAKNYLGMVEIMRALRRSIALNHRLAGEA